MMARSYPSWIAGVPYTGPDGTDRATFCAGLRPGDQLTLSPEPTNVHDPDAVAIYCRGHHLGYVPARHHWVHESLGEGDELDCVVTDVDCPTLGRAEHVHIRISVLADGNEPDCEVTFVSAPPKSAASRSLAGRIVGIVVAIAVVAAAALLAFGPDGSSSSGKTESAASQRSQEIGPATNSLSAAVPLPRPRQGPQAARVPLDIRPGARGR